MSYFSFVAVTPPLPSSVFFLPFPHFPSRPPPLLFPPIPPIPSAPFSEEPRFMSPSSNHIFFRGEKSLRLFVRFWLPPSVVHNLIGKGEGKNRATPPHLPSAHEPIASLTSPASGWDWGLWFKIVWRATHKHLWVPSRQIVFGLMYVEVSENNFSWFFLFLHTLSWSVDSAF